MGKTLKIGSTLQNGKYKIVEVLGEGGFGITYLAEHCLLGTKVAIKEFFFRQYCDRGELSSEVSLGTQITQEEVSRYLDKFLKEARTIARLCHPNIIKVHDIFKDNNTAYYVMDYIEGKNLADLIKQNGPLSETDALNYIVQASKAVEYIHGEHLNHLDIKPANLMLNDYDDSIILIDFGMSKQYDIISGNQTSTTPVGISHGYAPIEQYKEGGVKEFSPQTDIYSLGATLYKLVTGNTPPSSSDLINEDLPALPACLSDGTKKAIEAALQPRKKDRPQTIAEFLSFIDIDTIFKYKNTINKKIREEEIRKKEIQNKKELVLQEIGVLNKKQDEYNHEIELLSVKWKDIERQIIDKQSQINQTSVVIEAKEREIEELENLLLQSSSILSKDGNGVKALLDDDKDETIILQEKTDPATKEELVLCSKYGMNNDGIEAVDLGLSVKWSSMNMGASCPFSSGIHLEWQSNPTTSRFTKDWRLPTAEEFRELKDNCRWEWIDEMGVCGYLITSQLTGKKIFLRASGKCDGHNISGHGMGFYWSSSLDANLDKAYSSTIMQGTVLCYIQNPLNLMMSIRLVRNS